jgi:predicted acylesterase/phospholipase RssA
VAERRLAISIKGGVSLGTYEAGVLAETLSLIEYNNSQPGSTKWYIDAISGASAGSVTAALIAVALLNQKQNWLEEVWVNALSFDSLRPQENAPLSDYDLLDSSKLDTLAKTYAPFPMSSSRHAALRPGNADLRLRFCLSRAYPSITAVPASAGAEINVEEFAETTSFFINVSEANSLVFCADGFAAPGYGNLDPKVIGTAGWEALQQSAIASGSFPFAFAPRNLLLWSDAHGWLDSYFIDGGLFDNDPVGEAINLAHDIDWFSPVANAFDDADRRLLVVHTGPFIKPDRIPAIPDPYQLGLNVINSVLTESMESGLRGIIEVNGRVKQRADFLSMLANQIRYGASFGFPASLLQQLAVWRGMDVTKEFIPLRAALIPDLARTNPDIYAIVSELPQQQDKDRFRDIAFAFDLALDVADKVALAPIYIEPDAPLSGDSLYAFGGFLVRAFRQRDFAQGRYDARVAWTNLAGSAMNEFVLPPANELQYPNPSKPPSSAEVANDSANQEEYQSKANEFFDRVDAVLGALSKAATAGDNFSWFTSFLLKSFLEKAARQALNP